MCLIISELHPGAFENQCRDPDLRNCLAKRIFVPRAEGDKQTQAAGRTLGIEVQSLEVRGPDDFKGAFEAAKQQHSDALITVEDPLTGANRKRIVHFAAVDRLPSLHGLREEVVAGGLISYGANFADLFRRAAGYVDKILKGVKPADLPVQQPTKFELVINLKTAKAFGLQVPPSLLARADEVID